MEPGTRQAAGPLESLRALGATVVEMLGTRAELAVVELREEGERRKGMLVLLLVAAVFLTLGLLLAAAFVVVLFWDTHRLAALGGVTLLYLGIAAWVYALLSYRWRNSPPPFEATLRELAADRDLLGRRGE